MGFNFLHEAGAYASVPMDPAFWRYLFGKAIAWGMTMYEQDWLYVEYQEIRAMNSNLTTAYTWLHTMGDIASALNVTIQYCLPMPLHILASTAIPAVTNARASPDYHPGSLTPRNFINWDIGLSSLFYSSIGIQPSKVRVSVALWGS